MTATHPDAAWADRVVAAFAWWTAQVPTGGPTSSVTGSGAVDALERRVAALVGARFALALPSATTALRAALAGCLAGPGRGVLVCQDDWPAAAAAATSLGAAVWRSPQVDGLVSAYLDVAVAVVTPQSRQDTERLVTRAGGCVIEDRSALSLRSATPVAGVAAVYSLGPGKPVDCGEGGVLVTDNEVLWRRAVVATQHPVRQLIAGADPDAEVLIARIHPVSAVTALWELRDAVADGEVQACHA